MKHYITIATGQRIGIKAFCEGIRLAKKYPNAEFKYGLTTWYPTTGKEIMRQFRESIHDRINQKAGSKKLCCIV